MVWWLVKEQIVYTDPQIHAVNFYLGGPAFTAHGLLDLKHKIPIQLLVNEAWCCHESTVNTGGS
jgi:hypothetical protein